MQKQLKKFHENLEAKTRFNHSSLDVLNVNIRVINKFNCDLPKVKNNKVIGIDTLPDEIKKSQKEVKDSDCIDLLGVYCSPTKCDKANILLCDEKIKNVAKRYSVSLDIMQEFILIHEYAHAYMYSVCSANLTTDVTKSVQHVIIEESLATAVALKYMQDLPEYTKLVSFVERQAIQYRIGLDFLSNFSDLLEELMMIWKINKGEEGWAEKRFISLYENKNFNLEAFGMSLKYEKTVKKIGKYADLLGDDLEK